MINIPLLVFMGICAVYLVLALNFLPQTVSSYFHTKTDTESRLAMIFGNLTLGTGVVYTISIAKSQGILVFVPILATLAGYFALQKYYEKLIFHTKPEHAKVKNILGFIRYTSKSNGTNSLLYQLYTLLVIFTFLLLVCFEIYVSASLISPLIFGESMDMFDSQYFVGVVLIIVAMSYTAIGGMRAATLTDKIQAITIIIMFSLLIWLSLAPEDIGLKNNNKTFEIFGLGGFSNDKLVVLYSIVFGAIVTQFYNIINMSIGSDYISNEKSSNNIFKSTGGYLVAGLVFTAVIGFILPSSSDNTASLINLYQKISQQNNFLAVFVASLLMLGMTSLILTTVDTVVINASQLIIDNFSSASTFSNRTLTAMDPSRIVCVCIGLFILPISLLGINLNPGYIPFLLAVIFPITAVTPIIMIGIYQKVRWGKTLLTTTPVTLLLTVYIIGLYFTSAGIIIKDFSLGYQYAWITLVIVIYYFAEKCFNRSTIS